MTIGSVMTIHRVKISNDHISMRWQTLRAMAL